MDWETVAMTLITNAGNARSLAFQALAEAKAGNYEKSEELMKQSHAEKAAAHHAQTELLVNEANGNKSELSVLLIHAQDHLMTSMLAIELIEELIVLHKEKADREENK